MQNDRWQRIKDLFAEAGVLPPDRRDDFLRGAEPDSAIRAEVLALLAAHSPTLAPAGSGTASEAKAGGRIGPYKLLEVIGEGTFGTVYAAEQESPVRRRVALKIVKAGMDSREVVARFEQERQALALMDHPNIARVFDGGSTPNGRPFFVMELVKGDPITDYCDREKLTTAERLRLFVDVGRAVQHAHTKGVIHRDLKPSNVLVTLVDGKAIAKVIDFGVAKATQGRLTDKTLFTEHKQMIGTPLYMSPEQAHISGVDVDTRSDVYSLGVLLYELLTGTTPFRKEELLAADLTEMHRVLREVEPQKPSTRVATLGKTSGLVAAQRRIEVAKLNAMLRGDLDWIVMKCLEKERARRYETASDLVKDVERHLSGEPILAAPPNLTYRLRKFVRRNRGKAVATTMVVTVALGGLLATLHQASIRRSAQRETAATAAFTQALLHADLGGWSAALEQLTHASSLGHDPVATRLARVEVMEASGNRRGTDLELAALRQRADLGDRRDLVELLWVDPSRIRGKEKIGKDWREMVRTLENSSTLSPAWRAYARALLATTLSEASAQLDDVLAIDPRHRRAAEARLWLVLFQRGPESALREAWRFRLTWPQHDFGKAVEATSLRLLGRLEESSAVAGSIRDPELLAFHEATATWATKLATILDDLRSSLLGSTTPRLRTLTDLLPLVKVLEGTAEMNTAIRVHPAFELLRKQCVPLIPKLLSSGADAAILSEPVRITDQATLYVMQAALDCVRGDALRGLDRFRALVAERREDLWLSRQSIRSWFLLALRNVAGREALRPRGQQDKKMFDAIDKHARSLAGGIGAFDTDEACALTEIVSLLGDGWFTRECVAHVMRRPDATDSHRVRIVSCLLRGLLFDEAEEVLDPLLQRDPVDPLATRFANDLAARRADARKIATSPTSSEPDPPMAGEGCPR